MRPPQSRVSAAAPTVEKTDPPPVPSLGPQPFSRDPKGSAPITAPGSRKKTPARLLPRALQINHQFATDAADQHPRRRRRPDSTNPDAASTSAALEGSGTAAANAAATSPWKSTDCPASAAG